MSARSVLSVFGLLMLSVACLAGDADPTFQGKTAAQWLGQLKDKDAAARKAAAIALGKAGPKLAATVAPLVQAAADKDADVRLAAVTALASFPLEAEKVVPAMSRCLKDKEVKVRAGAVATLGTIAPSAKAAVPALATALRNEDIRIRVIAAEILGNLRADAVPAVPALLDSLNQKAVVGMLDGMEFLLDPAKSAYQALIAIGEPAIPPLLRAVKTRGEAAPVLATMVVLGTTDNRKMSPAVASILPALGEAGACEALGTCGPLAVPELTKLLKKPDFAIAAAIVLARHDMQEGLPVVIAALKDKNPKVRKAAAQGLGRTEQHARVTLKQVEAFKGKPMMKWAEMVRDEAVPELIRLLKDKDRDARVQAAYSLGSLGALDKNVVPALVNALKDKDAALHRPAVHGLGQIKTDDAMLGLVEGLRNKDREIREETVQEFRNIGRPAIAVLTKAAMDNDANVAKLADSTLKRIKSGN